ncbi:hypothetical protein CANARDRAFT_204542 [[Candida] arabinofermentans NRRL YB-2248]|uniref:Peptide hydrolase n=1 Tax=[Candida] arabinofermentans NRRL YB-2248 TaxID=983967 RepID=A0A1E4STH0_9ASCO|nr:hypothetical protein CANARDRAFT_204542 [[Candida] arabinofermentans NRRL YB-2248]
MSIILSCIFLYSLFGCFSGFSTSLWSSDIGSRQFLKSELYDSYLKVLETNLASNWSEIYAATPQLAGTNMEMVNWAKDTFESFGFDSVEIDEYDVYMSYPLDQSLKLFSKNGSLVYEASLKEKEFEEDPNSSIFVPAFLGYAESGDVTAEYVYCHFGTKEDYETLEKLGVELQGKIAVVRYGKIFRGLKVKFAQEHGMKAVLLYSDPFEDGDMIEENGFKPYPEGPARQPSSIQRGSVQFLSYGPGDPTTPGYAIKPGESKSRSSPYYTVPRIPALPISYEEVTPILQKLSGHGLKIDSWSDGLIKGFDYSVGPNPKYKLNLMNDQEFNISTMHNIMAKIEGENPNDVILIGNHHDSWIPSAGDPHSGSATMMEIARGLTTLTKLGWKPKRSIWIGSWDGEEYGLLGSTEFGEYFAKELQKNLVAYINLDVASIGGVLSMGASPLLHDLLRETADLLPYPTKDGSYQSLYEHFKETSNDTIHYLGSGSDYTVFLDHLGIPSVDLGFGPSAKDTPVYHYHSIYDSYNWMSQYGDVGFVFHNLMAKYVGLLTISLSETDILGLRTAQYGLKLIELFNKVPIPKHWLKNEAPSMSSPFSSKTKLSQFIADITSNTYSDVGSSSCGKFHLNGDSKTPTCSDRLSQLQNNLDELLQKAVKFDLYVNSLQSQYDHYDDLSPWQKLKLKFSSYSANNKLKYFERNFLNPDGLSDHREWFRHIVFTSGRYTGYGGQQLPGLWENVEDDNYEGFLIALEFLDKVVKRLIVQI